MNIADALMEDAAKKIAEKQAEIVRLKDVLREIASQCHNLPRTMNKDPESWARVHPEILEPQHLRNVLLMAIQDIATMHAEMKRLRSELLDERAIVEAIG
jgi:hypothetical protein